MTDTTATTPPHAGTRPDDGLGPRAFNAARARRSADPAGFDHRHDSPEHWNQWARRARVARTVAAALDVPVGRVTVTDDPTADTAPAPGTFLGT